ncbi:MMPL family transporter [Streptacidiphilus sp. P02-A3a]|uniref:MMPL family transporter n=1 Tax=Streptacidiphilus sp. P02-A3a TaxID=2704468 RepID=UPI0015FBAEF1|nr:MMPL family transporter [Streptacidiphilus sp. P02-A3a]QMU71126.1 MMPL family transporter [Streptacidiphilus sp. P02-A3a]
MSTYLFTLARWAFRRRRLVLGLWLLAAVVAIVLAVASGGKTDNTFTVPGTESQQAADLLKAKLPALGGGQTQLVFATHGTAKVTDPRYRAGIETSIVRLRTVPGVATVSDPFTAAGVSTNGQVALGSVQYTAQATDVTDATLNAVSAAVVPARDAGVEVEYSGSAYPGWRTAPSELPELIGLVVAFVILLITFGALVAAGLPILTAIIGIVITLMAVTALASVVTIASASTTVALMLGLSCGIDYGLFILARHRNQLLTGMEIEESVALAAGTAGSSVVFAALTVIIALCGLAVVGIPFLSVMGFAAAAAVLVALLIALTLLPAMLGFAGRKVAKFINTPLRPGHHEDVAQIAANEPARTFGARWARFVVRRRHPLLVGGVLLLLVLAVPALSMQLGLPSGSAKPTSDTQRRAYDLTTDAFGPGFNGPLLVVADGVSRPAQVVPIASALRGLTGVASASQLASANGVAVVRVIPTTGPNDPATADLVNLIRHNRSTIEGSSGIRILVGGTTASNIDVSTKLSSALPVFLVVVVGLAFILLTLAFRTILVPIKSIIGFLLSVAAAFGAEVAMFQWGWGKHVFGITPTETISFLPILTLAIIFGLSSDYEVFVVSRIKEDFTRTGEARGAVERGTGLAARVVTAAALIMFVIFVAFLLTNDPIVKAIGFSFAVGVFLDAFVVRLTLVPAVMAIVRAKLWYHPQWFARYVPDPDIEGGRLQHRLSSAGKAASHPTGASPDES